MTREDLLFWLSLVWLVVSFAVRLCGHSPRISQEHLWQGARISKSSRRGSLLELNTAQYTAL
jgi:hypothetical protein